MSDKQELAAPIVQLLSQSRQLLAKGDTTGARKALDEALEKTEDIDDTRLKTELTAAVQGERALLLQRLRDARGALDAYTASERASRELGTEDAKSPVRLQLATTLINMSGLLARENMAAEGRAKVEEALELLRGAEGELLKPARMLQLGALQNLTSLLLSAREDDAALSGLKEALEIGEALINEGAAEMLPQIVDIANRAAGLMTRLQQAEEALPVAEKASRWSEAAHSAGHPHAQTLFVNTQMRLLDVHFALKNYAEAENHLWKAVETADHPQIMIEGTNFYFALLHKGDQELVDGGLPREEIMEAFEDLRDKLADKKPPQFIADFLNARYAALVEGQLDFAQKVLKELSENEQARTALGLLLGQLNADIQRKLAEEA